MKPALHTPIRSVHGFTLLELMIVVGILAVLATVMLPESRLDEGPRLDAAAAEVAAALRFARSEAMRTSGYVGVNVSTADHRIRPFVYDFSKSQPAEDYTVRHPVTRGYWDVAFPNHAATAGVRVTQARYLSSSDDAFDGSVTFDARGRPVLVKNKWLYGYGSGGIDLAAGRSTRRVTLDAETGRVTVQ